mmetsp:Transcript_23042/g.64327  ORF Transcript_23042/g.64327 Transcript_23042/m.64327 type:complete len:223 (-) Transcript_23042:59-727(-)
MPGRRPAARRPVAAPGAVTTSGAGTSEVVLASGPVRCPPLRRCRTHAVQLPVDVVDARLALVQVQHHPAVRGSVVRFLPLLELLHTPPAAEPGPPPGRAVHLVGRAALLEEPQRHDPLLEGEGHVGSPLEAAAAELPLHLRISLLLPQGLPGCGQEVPDLVGALLDLLAPLRALLVALHSARQVGEALEQGMDHVGGVGVVRALAPALDGRGHHHGGGLIVC